MQTPDQSLIVSSGYKIECRSSQGDQEFNEPPSETELRVSDLSPSTNYRFRIQATNDRGSSPFTGERHFSFIFYKNCFRVVLDNNARVTAPPPSAGRIRSFSQFSSSNLDLYRRQVSSSNVQN